jgi:hypothetical protein
MPETLLQYQQPVVAPDGTAFEARACGSPMPDGVWQGWIEFIPLDGGEPTGVSPVYLEGALRRALTKRVEVIPPPPQPSVFPGPAPAVPILEPAAPTSSVLNPFSVYEKGEALLRRQLGALSAWHLVNIILDYELSYESVEALNTMPAATLVEIIVAAVQARAHVSARRT